jgi:hypothetical protein
MRAFLAIVVSVLVQPQAYAQARIHGQVVNGTTRQPVAGQEVRLLQPRGGMQQVGVTTTDAKGRFEFSQVPADPSSFYLASTVFAGVPYNVPVQFDSSGQAGADLTVYDATHSPLALRVKVLRVLALARGSRVRVREEYEVENASRPPRAYSQAGGTFHFRLPAGVNQPSVAVTGLMNMPLPQDAETDQRGFFIRYPLKPGTTEVAIQYESDYNPSGYRWTSGTDYPIDRVEFYLSPPTLRVDSPDLTPAGKDDAHQIVKYEAGAIPAGAELVARLSGEAAPPAAGEPSDEGGSDNGEGQDPVKVVPDAMTRLRWPLAGCFLLVLLWALGVRVAKEWPQRAAARPTAQVQQQLQAKAEKLLNSLADLDELFAAGKIAERHYWRERLELKAKLVALLKKSPPALLESYASRSQPR